MSYALPQPISGRRLPLLGLVMGAHITAVLIALTGGTSPTITFTSGQTDTDDLANVIIAAVFVGAYPCLRRNTQRRSSEAAGANT